MINVMIVDDHKMVREGLRQLIEFEGDIKVVKEAGNGNECLARIQSVKPDVILLDINMPVLDGLQTLKFLNQRVKRPKVIILTVHDEIEYVMRAVDIGINGYVLKDSDSHELIRAIRCVYNGENYVQPDMIPLLNSKLVTRDLDKEKVALLSARELEVLKLVAQGHFNKDIGAILSISERTVKNHMTNIFKKIDCSDRTQAAVFCIRNGIVGVND